MTAPYVWDGHGSQAAAAAQALAATLAQFAKERREAYAVLAEALALSPVEDDEVTAAALNVIAPHLSEKTRTELWDGYREKAIQARALESGDMEWFEAIPDLTGTDKDRAAAEAVAMDANGLLNALIGDPQ